MCCLQTYSRHECSQEKFEDTKEVIRIRKSKNDKGLIILWQKRKKRIKYKEWLT